MKRTLITGFIILFLLLGIGWESTLNGATVYDEVIRLHIIANSDSPEDQALKLQVKDQVVRLMRSELGGASDVKEAHRKAKRCLPRIEQVAEKEIKARGYDYPVKVYLGKFDFPTKYYGDLVFPQGSYTAVRVVIGAGRGKNWWCVLFPPLCLVASGDRGVSLGSADETRVKLKCMELLTRGVRLGSVHHR